MKVQSAMYYFPEEVIEHIFSFLATHRDRNAVSGVCRSWHRIERLSRRDVFVGNCYAVRPDQAAARFPGLRSLSLKGKPHFADFDLVPADWGGLAGPWIEAVARSCPNLEELRMKRMTVSDESLELLAHAFPNFKVLVLVSCDGFSTDGLAAVARNCKSLRELDLQENEIEDRGPRWLNSFVESCSSLVSLNFACLKGEINLKCLERLVSRSPSLKSLRLNRSVPVETLAKIISQCPNLEDLGTGALIVDPLSEAYLSLAGAMQKCKKLRSLSGFWDVTPLCLLAVYPVCANLTGLNLSYAPTVQGQDFVNLIQHCVKLQRLWVLDSVGDKGLAAVASSCKELQELRVFPSDLFAGGPAIVTEEGLVTISSGCPKLTSLLYFCHSMTNSALITVSKNCPNFTRFRLCILEPRKPDPVTNEPLDQGFGAVVKTCKNLKRFSISGLLTDQVFFYIGEYAKALEMLSIAFAGDSDQGMKYVLNGCKNLRKLEIRDCPFGDAALLDDVTKYETMRSLWMSSCDVSLRACKMLAAKMPMLNVELINERDAEMMEEVLHSNGSALDIIANGNGKGLNNGTEEKKVEKLYVYRTVGGPRSDAPDFVSIL